MASIKDWLTKNKINSTAGTELEALGVEDLEDLAELDEEDIKQISLKLKKVPARRFKKALAKLSNSKQDSQVNASHSNLQQRPFSFGAANKP